MAKQFFYGKDEISNMLDKSDSAVAKGIVAIYKRQTAAEQASYSTREWNSVGFTAFDAEFLTSLATQYISKEWLSPGQISSGRKAIRKYAGQLQEIANEGAALTALKAWSLSEKTDDKLPCYCAEMSTLSGNMLVREIEGKMTVMTPFGIIDSFKEHRDDEELTHWTARKFHCKWIIFND